MSHSCKDGNFFLSFSNVEADKLVLFKFNFLRFFNANIKLIK